MLDLLHFNIDQKHNQDMWNVDLEQPYNSSGYTKWSGCKLQNIFEIQNWRFKNNLFNNIKHTIHRENENQLLLFDYIY